jgi:hypothetical protein
MAVVATGLAVGGASFALDADGGSHGSSTNGPRGDAQAGVTAAAAAQTENETLAAGLDRAPVVTRSERRAAADPLKKDTLSLGTSNAMTRTEDLSDEDPRTIAQALLSAFGWSQDQFGCLDSLWDRESHWNVHADNPSSSAYGIPQALPGSKMSSAGADWANNPVTQIRWGLGYIADRYGSPCSAWGHSQSHGFY